jgi:hypothetical protein
MGVADRDPPVNEESHMQYMLLLYTKESSWAGMTPAQQEQGLAAYLAYTEALRKADAFRGVGRLRPSTTATTLRAADGKAQVLDGPYADTKEQLGGYYLIEAPDLDAAMAWAARCPTADHGVVEVRPLWIDGVG